MHGNIGARKFVYEPYLGIRVMHIALTNESTYLNLLLQLCLALWKLPGVVSELTGMKPGLSTTIGGMRLNCSSSCLAFCCSGNVCGLLA